jgi:hypothetical protein
VNHIRAANETATATVTGNIADISKTMTPSRTPNPDGVNTAMKPSV